MPFQYFKSGTISERHDVKASRAFNIIYQNTTGREIYVELVVACTRNAAIPFGLAYVDSYIEDVSPPTLNEFSVGLPALPNTKESIRFSGYFIVPRGWYYRVVDQAINGTVLLLGWVEWEVH